MKSVVLFSGGLDSYAALVLAREVSEVVGALHVRYGQPHGNAELWAAEDLVGSTPLTVIDVPAIAWRGDIALGRNPILLTLAASFAASMGASAVWAGFCQEDAAAFPDCRAPFLATQEMALRLALDDHHFTITAPLLFHTKAETFGILAKRRLLENAMKTHTCYRGSKDKQGWGTGCGDCSACITRAAGWKEFKDARS